MKRLALINPNTNLATTEMMAAIAQANVGPDIKVEGHTAVLGPTIITDETALTAAARQVETLGQSLARDGVDGLLISGFGDPGLGALRARLSIPVVGIAEAGMAAAAAHGDFAIITTTPDLRHAILDQVRRYGHEPRLAALLISTGGAEVDMASPEAMTRALADLAGRCEAKGARAVLIGGGPLARVAHAVRSASAIPVIEPVAAGAQHASVVMGSPAPVQKSALSV